MGVSERQEGGQTAEDCSQVSKNNPSCFSGNLRIVLEGDELHNTELSL